MVLEQQTCPFSNRTALALLLFQTTISLETSKHSFIQGNQMQYMKLDAIHPHQKPYQSVISTDLTESVMREANLSARWCVVHEPAMLILVLPPQSI